MTATLRTELKQATRLRVLETASHLFRAHGFDATTIRTIAEEAGVSPGTVMGVGDKHALLVQVFDTLIADEHALRAGDGSQARTAPAHSCADRLSTLVSPFVEMFTREPALARAYASILVSGTHSSALFTELASELSEEFAAAITERGCTSRADAPETAQALYFAYIGTLFSWSAQNLTEPAALASTLHSSFAAICTCSE